MRVTTDGERSEETFRGNVARPRFMGQGSLNLGLDAEFCDGEQGGNFGSWEIGESEVKSTKEQGPSSLAGPGVHERRCHSSFQRGLRGARRRNRGAACYCAKLSVTGNLKRRCSRRTSDMEQAFSGCYFCIYELGLKEKRPPKKQYQSV